MTTAETPETAANEQQNGDQRPLDLRTLFDAGVHFGHPSKRWNPKMEQFIFAKRARSHIFDLAKTVEAVEKAKAYLTDATAAGAQVLMVGTKKQAQAAIQEHALRAGAWYINQRWLGGMLTNFQTIQRRIERLIYLEDALAKGTVETQTKRESLRLQTEVNRLNKFFGGIKEMDRLPDILFIVDTQKEDIAVREAKRLGIPIVAIIDTNSNPEDATYIVPGNDDAVRSVDLLTAHIADAILEGRNRHRALRDEQLAAEAELEAQEAAARAAAQEKAAERAAAAAAEKQKQEAEAAEAAKVAEAAAPEAEAATDEKAEDESKAEETTEAKVEEEPKAEAEKPAKKAEAKADEKSEDEPKAEKSTEAKAEEAAPEAKKPAKKPRAKAPKAEEKPEDESKAEGETEAKAEEAASEAKKPAKKPRTKAKAKSADKAEDEAKAEEATEAKAEEATDESEDKPESKDEDSDKKSE